MKAYRCCSDGAFPSTVKRRPYLKVIDVPCPVCMAKPGVKCVGAGDHHTLRADAWREAVHKRSKKRDVERERRRRDQEMSHED